MTSEIRVSIILPIYNAELFLGTALRSILDQTFVDFELIAINDGSTDNSADILASFHDNRLRIINNDGNKGLIHTLNKGLDEAKGKYIARMDADDVALPNRLEIQLKRLAENPSIVLIGTNMEQIDSRGLTVGYIDYPETDMSIRETLKTHSAFGHPTVIFDKKAAIEVGGYRGEFKHCEDYDLWLRLSTKGELANVQIPLLRYRIHSNQITFNNIKAQHLAHMKAITDNLGITDYSIFDKITGKDGTLASKYLSIAYQQKQIGESAASTKLCLVAIFQAPLNPRAWKFQIALIKSSRIYDLIKYYKNKISHYVSGK
jgi:glycosyltransferase involved in cell wall biosynthesis